MQEKSRKTGIEAIGDIPWGTHFCLFYHTQEDLMDILVPYFKAGLENNEFCMWVTSEPLSVEEAKNALESAVENLEEHIEQGQIEILDYSQWYIPSGTFEADEVSRGWVEKEAQAVRKGFDGLRLTGNTFWLEKEDWKAFTEYEAMVDGVIGQYRMIAVCTYSLERCGASEVMDVVSNHAFALVRREGKWETIESAKRKRAEEALKEYAERLEEMVEERTKELRAAQERLVRQEKLAVLGQLAGGVSHELRNPLGVIKNAFYFLNMVLEEPSPEVKETLEILEREVAIAEKTISSLLDFARPRLPIRRPADLNRVVREALSRTTVPQNVELAEQLDETLPTAPVDPDQLVHAFGNILLNGIQAMPEGGRLLVKSSKVGRWVAVSVTDTGVGIPKENMGKIFEPLFTTRAKGIGLGLPLAKILVDGHGGTIEVESEVGRGSTFTVKLPLEEERP